MVNKKELYKAGRVLPLSSAWVSYRRSNIYIPRLLFVSVKIFPAPAKVSNKRIDPNCVK